MKPTISSSFVIRSSLHNMKTHLGTLIVFALLSAVFSIIIPSIALGGDASFYEKIINTGLMRNHNFSNSTTIPLTLALISFAASFLSLIIKTSTTKLLLDGSRNEGVIASIGYVLQHMLFILLLWVLFYFILVYAAMGIISLTSSLGTMAPIVMTLIFITLFIWLLIPLVLIVPILTEERKTPLLALQRAFQLAKGHRMDIFLSYYVFIALISVIIILVFFLMFSLMATWGIIPAQWLANKALLDNPDNVINAVKNISIAAQFIFFICFFILYFIYFSIPITLSVQLYRSLANHDAIS